jgi:hypothetical protein
LPNMTDYFLRKHIYLSIVTWRLMENISRKSLR